MTHDWKEFISQFIKYMGFEDYRIDIDEEHKHGQIIISDQPTLSKEQTALFIEHLNHLVQLIARKHNQDSLFFDINNYRRERENLIAQLARAAAQKVMATNNPISLPPMNSYERRLVHMALAHHPEVTTESSGNDKTRFVTIKLVEDSRPAENNAALTS